MDRPNAKMKIKKKGIEFTSHVDTVKYDIWALTSRALYDVGRYLRIKMIREGRKLRGMKNFKNKRIPHAFQHWVRKYDKVKGDMKANLWIGSKANTWYGDAQELGTVIPVGKGGKYRAQMKKRGIIKNTVLENIGKIQEIEARYLSAIADDLKARKLISEKNEGEDEE